MAVLAVALAAVVTPAAAANEGAWKLAARAAAVRQAPSPDAAEARRRAHEILQQRRYRGSSLPHPFKGVFDWVGDRLRWLLRQLDRAVPGGRSQVWGVGAMVVLALSVFFAARTIRRRAGAAAQARARGARPQAADPRTLEREAELAERDGAWDLAVRLRFRAGLLRLDRAGALDYRPSLTTGEVAAIVDSPVFDDLGATFDAIVYGGRRAVQEDAQAARDGWALVLGAVRA
jgi:hypothetical protein